MDPKPDAGSLAVIDIGNTRVAMGVWDEGRVSCVTRVLTSDEPGFDTAFGALCGGFASGRPGEVVIGSVVPAALQRVAAQVHKMTNHDARVIGADVPLPIPLDLRSPETVGVDRVCCAASAFDRVRRACIVVDFGSAITVDLVGDNGCFLGGAILPGAGMQVRALNEFTAALPRIQVQFPDSPVGDDTTSAIRSGVCHGIAGAVRGIVEATATKVGKWPHVVGTGGDLELFLPHCDFIDSAVPDLCLMGIGLAWCRRSETPEPGSG